MGKVHREKLNSGQKVDGLFVGGSGGGHYIGRGGQKGQIGQCRYMRMGASKKKSQC